MVYLSTPNNYAILEVGGPEENKRREFYDSLGRLTREYINNWDGLMNMLKKLITLVPSSVYSTIFE